MKMDFVTAYRMVQNFFNDFKRTQKENPATSQGIGGMMTTMLNDAFSMVLKEAAKNHSSELTGPDGGNIIDFEKM